MVKHCVIGEDGAEFWHIEVGAEAADGTLVPSIVDAKFSLSILHCTFETFLHLIEVIKEWCSMQGVVRLLRTQVACRALFGSWVLASWINSLVTRWKAALLAISLLDDTIRSRMLLFHLSLYSN